MDEFSDISKDLVQITRLALEDKSSDVRLFAARLVRKYRKSHPNIAVELESYLRIRPEREFSPLRETGAKGNEIVAGPEDQNSRLSLLRADRKTDVTETPILPRATRTILEQLVSERMQTARLAARGLEPTRSAIFVGPPGVGKTMTARWIAAQLGIPLRILDLAAVISSYLGRSGANVRSAFDYARSTPCVLLLDEIDAIAKRRSDEADVGELKRLVTVIMQEVDEWPAQSLLLAATNHRELIDSALWRRFDLVVEFVMPGPPEILDAIERFSGEDRGLFVPLMPALGVIFSGSSLSDVERAIRRARRGLALGNVSSTEILEQWISEKPMPADKQALITLAVSLAKDSRLSQHRISELTGLSRDTIRKHQRNLENPNKGEATE